MKEKTRTIKQNAAMHKYFDLVSKECNQSGVTFSEYVRLRPQLDMHWTPHRVKELWKEAQYHMYGTTSTTELKRDQIDKVFDVVNKALAEITGVSMDFPSIDALMDEELTKI